MEISLEAENLELSNDESNAEAGHETDANGDQTTKDMEVSLNGEYSTVSPEMPIAQEHHETEANGMELTHKSEVFLKAEISDAPNGAEKGPENDQNEKELTPEMGVSLDADYLGMSY